MKINKNMLALLQVVLFVILFWAFYFPTSPGFYFITFLATLFWRDPLMEMITGRQALDAVIFGMRWGQIVFISLIGIYFAATLALLTYLLWKAKANIFSRE
jgi:hypothetical protein